MNRITKFLAWLCIITCCLSCVGCEKKAEPQPILKVITSTQVGLTIFSYKRYYIVYDNGKINRMSEFTPSESIAYAFNPDAEKENEPYLYLIDTNTEEGEAWNNIAKSIISLTNNSDNISFPGALYYINEKYYFTASISKKNSEVNAIFEYMKSDSSIREVGTFKGSITHVEAYQ